MFVFYGCKFSKYSNTRLKVGHINKLSYRRSVLGRTKVLESPKGIVIPSLTGNLSARLVVTKILKFSVCSRQAFPKSGGRLLFLLAITCFRDPEINPIAIESW